MDATWTSEDVENLRIRYRHEALLACEKAKEEGIQEGIERSNSVLQDRISDLEAQLQRFLEERQKANENEDIQVDFFEKLV